MSYYNGGIFREGYYWTRFGCLNIGKNNSSEKYVVDMYQGSTLTIKFKFPYSLSEVSVSIVKASTEDLMDGEITLIDDTTVEVKWTPEQLVNLRIGSSNFFRIGAVLENGDVKNYGSIFINVQ